MLIDRAVAAHHNVIQSSDWTGNTALMVLWARPACHRVSRPLREGHKIRGLTAEEHISPA